MTRDKAQSLVAILEDRGFDKCRIYDEDEDTEVAISDHKYSVRVGCSQCEALVINGIATHEQRCPHIARDDDEE